MIYSHFCVDRTFHQFCLCPLDSMQLGNRILELVLFWILSEHVSEGPISLMASRWLHADQRSQHILEPLYGEYYNSDGIARMGW